MSQWCVQADKLCDKYVKSGKRFTINDITEKIGVPDKTHKPNSRNNEVGAFLRKRSARGDIVAVGTAKSSLPTRKGGLILEWRATWAVEAGLP